MQRDHSASAGVFSGLGQFSVYKEVHSTVGPESSSFVLGWDLPH